MEIDLFHSSFAVCQNMNTKLLIDSSSHHQSPHRHHWDSHPTDGAQQEQPKTPAETTNAIFGNSLNYSCHFFLYSRSKSFSFPFRSVVSVVHRISIDIGLAHKWTPLHPQSQPYGAIRSSLSLCSLQCTNIQTAIGEVDLLRVLVRGEYVHSPSNAHTLTRAHTYIDNGFVYSTGIVCVGLCVVRRERKRENKIEQFRYGIGLLRLSDCM